MANPKVPGRMLRRSIATDKGVARLTAAQTAVFCMILPHLDGYGKMLGEPAVVKEIALPFAPWATVPVVEHALKAISKNTAVKWFRGKDGRRYIHALRFEDHQKLEANKRGADLLPGHPSMAQSKSATKSATQSPPEVEVEVESESEGEKKEEGKGKREGGTAAAHSGALEGAPLASAPPQKGNGNGADKELPGVVVDALAKFPRTASIHSLEQLCGDVLRGGRTLADLQATITATGFLSGIPDRAALFAGLWQSMEAVIQ